MNVTALQQISAHFHRLGIPVPKPLVAAQAAADKFLAAVPRDTGNPIGSALDAVERGDDPFGPEIQRQIAMHRLTELNLSNAARLRAGGRLSDALAEHADLILAALADRLEGPAEAMVAAHKLGVTDLREARTLRGQQLSAWGCAAEAVDAFAIAHQIVGILSREMPHRAAPDKLRVLANATPAQLQPVRAQLAADNRLAAAWVLTKAGFDVAHVRSFAELDKRDNLGIDGEVEAIEPDDIARKPRTPASVTS
jgi:hypothetical protein